MTKQKLPNGDSVEISVTDSGLALCKYDKTGNNVINKTSVSLGDELVKLPFLCLVEKGGYCILWLQETCSGFVINIRKYTGLGLAGKITILTTENKPDGVLLNVLVQNGSLLTVEWSSEHGMFSGVFNVDGSVHTKETKIIHKTESLKEDVGKPTQENIKIEIVEKPVIHQDVKAVEEVQAVEEVKETTAPIQQEPVPHIEEPIVKKEGKKVSLEITIPPILEPPKEVALEKKQETQLPLVPQTPRRGVPMNFIANNSTNRAGGTRILSMNKRGRQRMGGSMGMKFI